MTRIGIREALIVAVSDYGDPRLGKLRAPAADAEKLAAVLRNPEIGAFDVEVLRNPEERDLRRRLATFFGAERRADDLLLVHFSCHGVKDQGGELYLACADTEKDLLDATGIDATWLNRRIGRCRSKRIVVLLDCCFSGSFPFGMHARAGDEVDVQAHLEGRGRAVITASNAMEYAYEGDELTGHGQPSVFTDAVVEGLATGKADRDQDKLISIQELYDYVFDRVKETQPAQTPNIMSTLEGPLYLARSSYEPRIEPTKFDDRLLELIEHPYTGARLGAVDELAGLLASRSKSLALAARLALERMKDDDSRRVGDRAHAALAEPASGGDVGREAEEQASPEPIRKRIPRLRPGRGGPSGRRARRRDDLNAPEGGPLPPERPHRAATNAEGQEAADSGQHRAHAATARPDPPKRASSQVTRPPKRVARPRIAAAVAAATVLAIGLAVGILLLVNSDEPTQPDPSPVSEATEDSTPQATQPSTPPRSRAEEAILRKVPKPIRASCETSTESFRKSKAEVECLKDNDTYLYASFRTPGDERAAFNEFSLKAYATPVSSCGAVDEETWFEGEWAYPGETAPAGRYTCGVWDTSAPNYGEPEISATTYNGNMVFSLSAGKDDLQRAYRLWRKALPLRGR